LLPGSIGKFDLAMTGKVVPQFLNGYKGYFLGRMVGRIALALSPLFVLGEFQGSTMKVGLWTKN